MEIERKFLVDKNILLSKIDLNNYEGYRIEQVYISTEDNEIRIRKVENKNGDYKCYMAIKSKGDLKREEVEFEIPYDKYRSLVELKMYKGDIIDKFRYKIPLSDNLVAELDVYEKRLSGLVMVEVEFETEEEAKLFKMPDWFLDDVTYDKKYKNRNLAINS